MEWEDALEVIEEMLNSPNYEYAGSILTNMYEWIEENGHVTERQLETIEKIRRKI